MLMSAVHLNHFMLRLGTTFFNLINSSATQVNESVCLNGNGYICFMLYYLFEIGLTT